MEEELTEGKAFATFEKYEEFRSAQESFLSLDSSISPTAEENRSEVATLQKLIDILDEYQEQSYLLDPFLENLVPMVVGRLKTHAKLVVARGERQIPSSRVGRVALLLYHYVKCRGHKTIVRYFPHEIADLSIVLDYMTSPVGPAHEPAQWALRYVSLLWLSLIIMIPFDLEQFDENDQIGHTATSIESVAKQHLGKAGLERDGAAMLLSRLYMRKDTISRFGMFLDRTNTLFKDGYDQFTMIGILQTVCEIIKSGPMDQIKANLPQILQLNHAAEREETLRSNTLIRKFQIKLTARIGLRLLPAPSRISRLKGRALSGVDTIGAEQFEDDSDIDVPEEVESILEELFRGLQDKDTIVRWSAAKGVARISERLSADFIDQVLDTVIGLFSIHSVAAASLYDMPAIAESTWHGACLACAEMARRGLIGPERLSELVDWLSKALYFDIRKGAHSIGSNVRDAASYVLWALARAQVAASIAPHASSLASKLVTVALFDREIHIRRAASAAYQEHVGRLNLFPHGIDVLRKTDFYAVSVRRNAFLVAAPQVAVHDEYRPFLIDHILNITLRHWDSSMRRIGAQSLQAICSSQLSKLGPYAAHRVANLLGSVDVTDIHGGLLALTELAAAYRDSDSSDELEPLRRQTFSYIARMPQNIILSPRNELVAEAACYLIANSITLTEIQLDKRSTVSHWRETVEYGLRHRSSVVREAAAGAMATISKLVDCSAVLKRLIRELKSGSPIMQQSLGRLLGVLDYDAHPHGLDEAILCLLECVTRSSATFVSDVEARRNCFEAMPRILATVIPRLSYHLQPGIFCQLYGALFNGLDDYTVDERGDVGSWIRRACIQGLAKFSELLLMNASRIPKFEEYLPAQKYHGAIGGILRQGVERLDGVRAEAGAEFLRLLSLPLSEIPLLDPWHICGESLMRGLFLGGTEKIPWSDGSWLFPRAVKLLDIEQYRKPVLVGLMVSLGSKTDSTQRQVASSLVTYASALPLNSSEGNYDLLSLTRDLLQHATSQITLNTAVIPTLQTFNTLLEGDALVNLADDFKGLEHLRALLSLATRNVKNIKSIQRIHESMKIIVNLLPFAGDIFNTAAPELIHFLAHQFPKVRTDTAEYLYLVLQSRDIGKETDDEEDILLETEWSLSDPGLADAAARRLVGLLLGDSVA